MILLAPSVGNSFAETPRRAAPSHGIRGPFNAPRSPNRWISVYANFLPIPASSAAWPRAASSLPMPLSPSMSSVVSVGATRSRTAKIRRMATLVPSRLPKGSCWSAASAGLQGAERCWCRRRSGTWRARCGPPVARRADLDRATPRWPGRWPAPRRASHHAKEQAFGMVAPCGGRRLASRWITTAPRRGSPGGRRRGDREPRPEADDRDTHRRRSTCNHVRAWGAPRGQARVALPDVMAAAASGAALPRAGAPGWWSPHGSGRRSRCTLRRLGECTSSRCCHRRKRGLR